MTGSSPDCHGNGAEHCCWVEGEPCQFLEVDAPGTGRKWSCGLRNLTGDWSKVHRHPLYKTRIRPWLEQYGIADCGDWRIEGQCCYGPDNPPIHNQ